MTNRTSCVARVAIVVFGIVLVSCSSGFIGQRNGTIVIATGPASGSRSLTSGWPMGDETLPEFSTLAVVVRGQGMDTLVANIDLTADTSPIQLTVKAGLQRSVYVAAIPDWAATALKYPDADLPTLAASFSGGTVVDIPADSVVPVTVQLAMASTKILIPDLDSSLNFPRLSVANSIAIPVDAMTVIQMQGLTTDSNFVFGDHGRLFVSTTSGVRVYGDLSAPPIETFSLGQNYISLALCRATNRLYGFYDSDGSSMWYVDLDDEARTVCTVNEPDGFYFAEGGIAVDGGGNVFVPAVDSLAYENVIIKMTVDEPVGTVSDSTAISSVSFESIGLGYVDEVFSPIMIEDMTVVGGTLYIAACDTNAYDYMYVDSDFPKSRGLVLAVNTGTMMTAWSSGWSGDFENFPVDAGTQFYGPRRFVAIAPKRLYVADDGFSWDGSYYGNYFVDVDRIVALDTETGSVVASGLDSASTFYEDYSSMYQSYSGC